MIKRKTRVIAVANEKGGVGKTVTVINLGAALSRLGHRVLIVDMDPQANATKGLGVVIEDRAPSGYDILMNSDAVPASNAILNTRWQDLDVLPGHIDLAGAEIELIDVRGRENRLKDALAHCTENYDFVLLDTPPSLSLLTINVFAFAHEVLIPCQTHPYAYGALEELFDTIHAVNREINPNLKISGIVPTLFDQRTKVSHRILEKLQQDDRYKDLLLKSVIRINTTIADSADVGKPVVFYRSGSYGSVDYMALAEELQKKT
jgi:chromosome partitioning protein